MPKASKSVIVKQENETVQSYINSFKEIEEPEPSSSNKIYLTTEDQLASEDYEQLIVRDENEPVDGEDDYKYVFIVEGGDDEKQTPADGNDSENQVYEFDEYDEENALDDADDDDVDDKTKIVKIISHKNVKKGVNVPATGTGSSHLCSFCNYSTPKRYLLARHMKCHSEDR
jgi:hypothetical protein